MLYFLPFITSILNRFRGDDTLSKGVWMAIMSSLSLLVTFDPVIIAAWTVFILAYSIQPWHAMFSAIHGQPPSRVDAWHSQWMQEGALILVKWLPAMPVTRFWRIYGVVYGVFRALPAMLPVLFLYGYTGNLTALLGLALLLMGLPYYIFGRLLKGKPAQSMVVGYAELTIGYLLGVYLLVL